MLYVKYHSLKCIVDKFLFSKYLRGDAKRDTIFPYLDGYLKKHNIPHENITAVATDSTPAMVGHCR